jgi:hypothetical protein
VCINVYIKGSEGRGEGSTEEDGRKEGGKNRRREERMGVKEGGKERRL